MSQSGVVLGQVLGRGVFTGVLRFHRVAVCQSTQAHERPQHECQGPHQTDKVRMHLKERKGNMSDSQTTSTLRFVNSGLKRQKVRLDRHHDPFLWNVISVYLLFFHGALEVSLRNAHASSPRRSEVRLVRAALYMRAPDARQSCTRRASVTADAVIAGVFSFLKTSQLIKTTQNSQ